MSVTAVIILVLIWFVLAAAFYVLWLSWSGNTPGGVKEDKARTLAMIAEKRRKMGIGANDAVERLEETGGADPKTLAERLKTWLDETDDDKISK